MRVLITGATGFLGSHLCRRMVADGQEVRILVRPTSKLAVLDGLPVQQAIGDVTDPASVRLAVRERDWVVHAAATLSYWGRDQPLQANVNVNGTHYLAEACRMEGVRRLVHVSSVAAIGIPADPHHPAAEDFPFNLETSGLTYHLSKQRAEERVMGEVARGLNAVVVNPASIFGPYGARYRGGEMIRKVRRTPIVPYFRGGICVVHVQDVIGGILAALERGATGQRYILGGENLTYRSLAVRAARAMGLSRLFVPVPPLVTGLAAMVLEPWGRVRHRRPRITSDVHYFVSRYHFYDSGKARRMLDYAPRPFDVILDEYLRSGLC